MGLTCLLLEDGGSHQRVNHVATQNHFNSRVHGGGHGLAGHHLLSDLRGYGTE